MTALANQIIDHSWENAVQQHCANMDTKRAALNKYHSSVQKFLPAMRHYEESCADFLDYIAEHFQSNAEFANFLKAEAASMFPEEVDSKGFLDQFNWRATQIDPVRDAENLVTLYKETYSEIAYQLAFSLEKNPTVFSFPNIRFAL